MDATSVVRLRRIALAALAIGYLHLVVDLSRRYLALGLSVAIVGLLLTAWSRRGDAGVAGAGGVLRPAALAAALVVVGTVVRVVIVPLDLSHGYVQVVQFALELAVLAALAVAAIRAGARGSDPGRSAADAGGGSRRTFRGARALAAIVFIVLMMGALTANLPGANVSCTGFPLCRNGYGPEFPFQKIQLAHRVLAFAVLFHSLGLLLGVRRRAESAPLRQWAVSAFVMILLQLLLAAAMVEMHLPPWARLAHQALGAALWLVVVVFAALASRATAADGAAARP